MSDLIGAGRNAEPAMLGMLHQFTSFGLDARTEKSSILDTFWERRSLEDLESISSHVTASLRVADCELTTFDTTTMRMIVSDASDVHIALTNLLVQGEHIDEPRAMHLRGFDLMNEVGKDFLNSALFHVGHDLSFF